MVKAVQVKDFPNYYVTENGDVYSRNYGGTGRIKKLKPHKTHGYIIVQLSRNKKNFHKLVHRLVAQAFIPNPKNKREVNHINGIKTDNRVENLEWVTSSENKNHAYKVLKQEGHLTGKYGKLHPKSKIVLQIKNNIIINKFYGRLEAQRMTGINAYSIWLCCVGKAKTAGGFEWKYKNF